MGEAEISFVMNALVHGLFGVLTAQIHTWISCEHVIYDSWGWFWPGVITNMLPQYSAFSICQ